MIVTWLPLVELINIFFGGSGTVFCSTSDGCRSFETSSARKLMYPIAKRKVSTCIQVKLSFSSISYSLSLYNLYNSTINSLMRRSAT